MEAIKYGSDIVLWIEGYSKVCYKIYHVIGAI